MPTNTPELTPQPGITAANGQFSYSRLGVDITSQEIPLLNRDLCDSDFVELPDETRKKVLRELELAKTIASKS